MPPTNAPDLEPKSSRFIVIGSGLFSWIILPLGMVLILHAFVFQAYHVQGTSMLGTLHDRDYLIVSKIDDSIAGVQQLAGHTGGYIPARGQIIVFHYPVDPTEIFVKRVIGLPGDRVVVQDGTVTVFSKAQPQGYNPDIAYEPSGTQTLENTDVTVSPAHVFVMGDNRTPGGSLDSRTWGLLPSENIIGNVVLRLLPLSDTRLF